VHWSKRKLTIIKSTTMAKCISPITVQHAGERHVVPCGKCNFCLETRRNHWCFRLSQELKKSTSAYFITLTYDEDNVPIAENGSQTLVKRDLQLFWKSLRKSQAVITDLKLRYFIAGEYGSQTKRPHYHAIVFNLQIPVHKLQEIWKKGFVHCGRVTGASIRYVTKYIINRYDEVPGTEPSFRTYVA